MQKFTHLHTHSHYSLLQALPKIPDLVGKAKEYGMEALALTDNGNMYGTIEFYKECKKADVKPIIGVDFYVASRTRFDKEPRIDSKRTRLLLLAKDVTGYKNLLKLVTYSHLDGFYYKPRIDKELIEKYSEGIIAISPAWDGDIGQSIRVFNEENAKSWAVFYKQIFKKDFYIEISRHPEIDNHDEIIEKLISFAKETSIPLVAGQEVYYIHPEDKQAQRTLMSVQKSFGEGTREEDESNFSFLTSEQMENLFKDIPEALLNNQKISDACNLEIPLGKWLFPTIEIPEGRTPDEELRRIVYDGFTKRGVLQDEDTVKRVDYELGVIGTKGYAPYFLVVADLLRYAKEKGILSNIRGSVSGSMVTFLAGITNINPLVFEIPFERFLNPDRPSAPDIDMDFADNRRDEMVAYTREKYGADKVAQIGTFGTMAARGAVRDVARALGFPVATGDRISKMIPMGSQGFPMTIEKAIEETPELKEAYEKEKEVKEIINMALKIEGSARHISVHAAGVVISPLPLIEVTPLQYDTKGEQKIITQYDMYSIDEDNAGLLKFDFLGLKNLSIIADTLDLIKKRKNISIDTDTIPLDDQKTFEMLSRGETADTFQLNGDGMTRFLKELKPSTIHDINAMVALYRPGPLQFIPVYIACKHDPSKVVYLDPALEPILKKTYGVLVYQDDLLMMANKLAGYTWGEVDKFRKAVGKKIPKEMAEQKEKFIKGCVSYSKWPQKKAEELWTWIEPFASYAFNKAHSVSYGRVAYLTAYFKANFPAEYMSAVLTHESGDIEKVALSVHECTRMGIEVLPPSINESFGGFTIIIGEDGKEKIRFGLSSIKNFGEGIAETIIKERGENGKYKTLEEFLTRIHDRSFNKKSLEALIKSGALDAYGERGKLFYNIEALLSFSKLQNGGNKNQDSLFGSAGNETIDFKNTLPFSTQEKLLFEKESIGLYISGHPLDRLRSKMEAKGISIENIKQISRAGQSQTIVGVPEEVKEIKTKNGATMAFMKCSDFGGSIEVVLFPKIYEEIKNLLSGEKCLYIEGTYSVRNDTPSLLANKIKEV